MANEQHQLPTPSATLADMRPEPPITDDGGSGFSPSSAPPSSDKLDVATHGEGDTPPTQEFKDEKRNAIFARAKTRRAEQMEDFDGDANNADARYGKVDQSEMGDLEREALERRKQYQREQVEAATEQPQQQPAKPANPYDTAPSLQNLPDELRNMQFTLKVDGRDQPITIEELIRNEQKNRAADSRFELSKQLLQQAQEMSRLAQQPEGQPDHRGQSPRGDNPWDAPADGHTSHEQPALDVKSLVEKIQLGTADEAAEALTQFFNAAQRQAQPQVDDTTRVLTAIEDHNAAGVVADFAQRHPEVRDPDLQGLIARNTVYVMADDLERAGYTTDWLKQNVPSIQALKDLHKMARIQRMPGIRSTNDVLEAALQSVKQKATGWAGSPTAPAPSAARPANQPAGLQQRADRKQGLAQQPALRRAQAPQPPQQRTQEQSRAAAVAQIRARRGQST